MPSRTLPPRKSNKRNENGLFHSLYVSPKVRLQEKMLMKRRLAKRAVKEKQPLVPKAKRNVNNLKTKPTYSKMIRKALIELNQRNGSSLFNIYKYLEENYPIPDNYRRYVTSSLRKGVDDGSFERVRGSYRITSKGRKGPSKKKKKDTKRKRSKSPKSAKKKSSKKDKSKSSSSSSSSKKKASNKKSTSSKKKGKKSSSSSSSSIKKKSTREKGSSSSSRSEKASSNSKKQSTTPAGNSFAWQFQEGSNWFDYEVNASDVVEAAYQSYMKNPGACDVRAVRSGQWQYQVDFINMKQTNIQHENHRVRSIRRIPYKV